MALGGLEIFTELLGKYISIGDNTDVYAWQDTEK
jgi:hypothetical protein